MSPGGRKLALLPCLHDAHGACSRLHTWGRGVGAVVTVVTVIQVVAVFVYGRAVRVHGHGAAFAAGSGCMAALDAERYLSIKALI